MISGLDSRKTWTSWNSPGISFPHLENLENLEFHSNPPGISRLPRLPGILSKNILENLEIS